MFAGMRYIGIFMLVRIEILRHSAFPNTWQSRLRIFAHYKSGSRPKFCTFRNFYVLIYQNCSSLQELEWFCHLDCRLHTWAVSSLA
jgi:hypothetical protein